MLKRAIFVGFAIAFSCLAQQRFPSSEFKGFTKSPTEHVISRVDEPFTVSSVRGMIVLEGEGDPLRDVTFEIRGPGTSERIRATKSDGDGRLSMGGVPEGTHVFKATKDGLQSVVGTLIVSKKVNGRKVVKIEMPLGV